MREFFKRGREMVRRAVVVGELVGSGKFVNQNTLVANQPRKDRLRRSSVTLFRKIRLRWILVKGFHKNKSRKKTLSV